MRQISTIQSLRALAALMVIVGHAQTEAAVAALKHGLPFTPAPLLPWGAGVDLFFVISGFIMVVASERLFAQPGGGGTFVKRRLMRIVPLYWLATSLYVLIQIATHKPLGGGDLVASYLFWPRDVYGDGVLRPIYALGWTLQYEMFFYALFATAIWLPRRACVATVTVVLALGVAVGQIWASPVGPLSFWTQPIVLEFALGMGLGLAWREGVRLGVALQIVLVVVGSASLSYDIMNAAHQAADWVTPNSLIRVLAWGVPAACLVAAASLGRAELRWLAGTVALGDASYALYLVHPFIIGTLMRIWTVAGLAPRVGYWPFIAASLALAIAAAMATHRWIEAPIAGFRLPAALSRRRPA